MSLTVGRTIAMLRRVRGEKLGDVASRSGISTSYLSLVENDARQPSLDVVKRVASALDVPYEVFIAVSTDRIRVEHRSHHIVSGLRDLLVMEEKLRCRLDEPEAPSERGKDTSRVLQDSIRIANVLRDSGSNEPAQPISYGDMTQAEAPANSLPSPPTKDPAGASADSSEDDR